MKTKLVNTYQQVALYVTKSNRNKLISVLLALLLIILISTFIALITQNNNTTTQTASQAAPAAQINITKDGFVPAALVVKKGTKITWTNTDATPHQIQANPYPAGESLPGLKSEILNNLQTYQYTADTTGSFGYHDKLNPTVNGTIDVQE